MSQENVEHLRDWSNTWNTEAWRRGEFDTSLLDSQVTYEDTVLPDHVQETYRGHEGVIRATERWLEPFVETTIELVEILGTGDRLVSVQQISGKARHTGIEFSVQYAYEWTFRDGKVINFRSYLSRDEALKAAGLSE